MLSFIVLETFKGSVTGSDVTEFKKDQVVTESQIGKELLAISLKEEWIKTFKISSENELYKNENIDQVVEDVNKSDTSTTE